MKKNLYYLGTALAVTASLVPTNLYALDQGAYTVSTTTSYVNPATGKTSDGGSNVALGEGMARSVITTDALLEVDENGKQYVTLRVNLMSNLKDISFSVGGSKVSATVMQKSSGADTADYRFAMSDTSGYIAVTAFVIPMDRNVTFYVGLNTGSASAGNGSFVKSVKDPVKAEVSSPTNNTSSSSSSNNSTAQNSSSSTNSATQSNSSSNNNSTAQNSSSSSNSAAQSSSSSTNSAAQSSSSSTNSAAQSSSNNGASSTTQSSANSGAQANSNSGATQTNQASSSTNSAPANQAASNNTASSTGSKAPASTPAVETPVAQAPKAEAEKVEAEKLEEATENLEAVTEVIAETEATQDLAAEVEASEEAEVEAEVETDVKAEEATELEAAPVEEKQTSKVGYLAGGLVGILVILGLVFRDKMKGWLK